MPDRLDLLYFGTLPPHPGGSAISMSLVLKALAARGHRVRAVGPTTDEDLTGGDQFAQRSPELEVYRFVMPFLDTAPDILKPSDYQEREERLAAELGHRLIETRRPDVVIAGRESFVRHVADIAGAHGIPLVASARGSSTHAMVDGTYPPEFVELLVEQFRRAALVITPARHLADSLGRLGVAGIEVVRNMVDLERFRPLPKEPALLRALDIEPDATVVGHFSNLVPSKRPLDFVHGAARALSVDPGLVFLVVGDGPLRAELAQAAALAGMSDSFRFTGWVDYEKVPAYLGVTDIVVQPSRAEGQARIYLEAQAMGRTLIASDIPAAREVVVDGETGLLHPTGDVQALADAILRAAGDSDLRASIGRSARAAAQAYAIPAVAAEHERLLLEAAG